MDYSHHNEFAPSLSHLLAPFAPHFIERASRLINSQYEKQRQQQTALLSVSQKKEQQQQTTINCMENKSITNTYACVPASISSALSLSPSLLLLGTCSFFNCGPRRLKVIVVIVISVVSFILVDTLLVCTDSLALPLSLSRCLFQPIALVQ